MQSPPYPLRVTVAKRRDAKPTLSVTGNRGNTLPYRGNTLPYQHGLGLLPGPGPLPEPPCQALVWQGADEVTRLPSETQRCQAAGAVAWAS